MSLNAVLCMAIWYLKAKSTSKHAWSFLSMISSDAKKLQAYINCANWASENYDRVQCVKREHGTRRDDMVKCLFA